RRVARHHRRGGPQRQSRLLSYRIKITPAARVDLVRLFKFQSHRDLASADRAYDVLVRALDGLALFPYSCRKLDPNDHSLREHLIPFGNGGYLASFRIVGKEVRILAIRHQL